MRNADLKKIARDPALNSDAVRVVIFVETHGKGKHPISTLDFKAILGHPGDKKLASILRLVEYSGWVRREKGGWGNPDSWEFVSATDPAKTAGTVEATDPAPLSDTQLSLTPPKEPVQDTDPAKSAGSTRARAFKDSSSSSCSYIENEIDPRVEVELQKDRWSGFRSSLRDYFESRVKTEKQWGYLMTVRTWFDGSPYAPKGFGKLTNAQQRLLMATAVNELLAQSPVEEKLAYRSSQGMAGNTSTLRSKLEYHIRRKQDDAPTATQPSFGRGNVVFPEDKP